MKLSLFTLLFFLIHFSATSQTSTALNNLEFGDQIFPGISKTIDPDEGGAAEFKISGEAGTEIHVTFYLPSSLIDVSNNLLPISFSTVAGLYSTDQSAGSSTAFDPQYGFTTTLSSTGELYVWIGGTIYPNEFQPGNTYRGDITLDVSYTTN